MPSTRLSNDDRMELALDDLVQAGTLLDDVDIVASGPDKVNIHWGVNEGWPALVLSYDAVDEAQARQLVAAAAKGHKVVVANRISGPARRYLASQNWAWLDRRIGAHLPLGRRAVEIRLVDRDQLPGGTGASADRPWLTGPPRPSPDGPIRGRAGIAYAAAVLSNRSAPPSLRSVAAAAGMSPTAISNAAKRLIDVGLIGTDGKPTLPELFWSLAEVWKPLKAAPVASVPAPDGPQITGRDQPTDGSGWVLGGDLAAAELGAPLFSTETRPWLWLPTQVDLRRAERTYGRASWADRAAVLAVPPTPLVCINPRPPRPDGLGWPLPHPVFAALDLAQDRERGREILSQWSPEGAEVVWR